MLVSGRVLRKNLNKIKNNLHGHQVLRQILETSEMQELWPMVSVTFFVGVQLLQAIDT